MSNFEAGENIRVDVDWLMDRCGIMIRQSKPASLVGDDAIGARVMEFDSVEAFSQHAHKENEGFICVYTAEINLKDQKLYVRFSNLREHPAFVALARMKEAAKEGALGP